MNPVPLLDYWRGQNLILTPINKGAGVTMREEERGEKVRSFI